jgi:ABC-type protease/lipase transport system fused ATPase/permease subunit
LKQDGVTVVVVSHRQSVLSIADRVMLMRSGQIEAFGTRDQVAAWLRSRAKPAGQPASQLRRPEVSTS